MYYYIETDKAISIFDEWISRGHNFMWSRFPTDVRDELLKSSINGVLDYEKAVRILFSAKTTKMRGDANKGLEYIKSEWKKQKFTKTEFN